MDPILRFDGAVSSDPAVGAWFRVQTPELGAIARRWFERMRACGGDTTELLHDGCPVACVENAPFGYVNVFKAHVNVGFFHGAELEDDSHLLEGNGRHMRHVKLRPSVEIHDVALQALIDAAYADIKWRLEVLSE